MKNKGSFILLPFFILLLVAAWGCEAIIPSIGTQGTFREQDSFLSISFIDVGQGDCTLVECDGKAMLIDAGLYGQRYKVLSYLSERGIESLEYCVATHPHADHIGAMADVIYSFSVDTLVYPRCQYDSSAFNYVLDAADEKDVSYLTPEAGDSFTLGSATVAVLSPSKETDSSNLNNISLVLKLSYQDVSVLFTGDAEKEIETTLLRSEFDLKANLLKCGHHGSSTSSCREFVKAVNPSAAVISCGKDNEYGHPHAQTLTTLSDFGITVYRTDLSSTIVASCTDGKHFSFSADRAASQTQTKATEVTSPVEGYIGNKNSKIFHNPDCNSVAKAKDKNKVVFSTRKEATENGYSPCKTCNP